MPYFFGTSKSTWNAVAPPILIVVITKSASFSASRRSVVDLIVAFSPF